tara:strand:+ start:1584 stop:3104 length:1521 start_codon:yes stop_codon:yes gene_type:complete
MATFVNTTQPTPFGVYDNDSHFQEDADGVALYVKRRLGDDVLSVELTNKQIWANFEEAALEFSKQINAHQAESYMSNILGLNAGPNVTFKKNDFGHYYWLDLAAGETADDSINDAASNSELRKNVQVLLIQNPSDPRFRLQNKKARYKLAGTSISITREIEDDPNDNSIVSPIEDKKVGPNGQEQKFPRETLEYLLRRAEPYASEAYVGGVSNSLRGFIPLEQDKQDYNIYKDMIVPSGNNQLTLEAFNGDPAQLSLFNPVYKNQLLPTATPTKIKVNEVFHFSPQAAYRFFDTTSAINYLNNQFAFESFTPETVFYVLPVFEDLLRAGQLDISNRVRRSNFSYRIQGQELRIFPRPTQSNPLNLFIKFSFPQDPFKPNLPYDDDSITGVSNLSNVPFDNVAYSGINQMSRQWIRQYTLALCKETLGLIRSKFSSVPIPGSDVQLNGSELISQGREDRQRLAESLSETLDKLTYQKLLETDAAQSESMMNILKRVPIPNGRAIIIG